MNCVCAKQSEFKKRRRKKGIPEVHSPSFLGGGQNIRRNKEKVVEPDRQGEREFTNRPESWTGRQEEESQAEKEKEKAQDT